MEIAFFTACSLLALGFLLRAKIHILQLFYVPAAVIGGIVGMIALTMLMPVSFTTGHELAPPLNNAQVDAALRRVFAEHDSALVDDVSIQVQVVDERWRVDAENASYLIESEGQRLVVRRLHLGPQMIDILKLRSWPSWLIAVIFAGLLMKRSGKPFRESIKGAARQGIVVWIIILGEIAVGVAATWLIIKQSTAYALVPGSFGQLIETGFAGGHGTATAMGKIFKNMLNFKEGADLGFVFATVGLIYGVVTGIVFINLAVRCGWTRAGNVKIPLYTGLEERSDPQPIAMSRVRSEVIDPLVFQALILASAVVLGMVLKWFFLSVLPMLSGPFITSDATHADVLEYADNLPLFMFTLLAGLLVREIMHLLKIGDLIDPDSIKRITGAAIEFLIVAAITTLKISTVIAFGWPILLLLVLGFIWTGFCLLFIARRLLPKAYWFELGILNYGMSTGTTAQGMMLLRIIDKDLDSGATEDYALAAPLSAPFIGGGVITLVVLPALLEGGHIAAVVLGLVLVIVGLYFLGRRIAVKSDVSPG